MGSFVGRAVVVVGWIRGRWLLGRTWCCFGCPIDSGEIEKIHTHALPFECNVFLLAPYRYSLFSILVDRLHIPPPNNGAMAQMKGTSRRQLRSSSFTKIILCLICILVSMTTICNIKVLQAHLNDTAGTDHIHSPNKINRSDRNGVMNEVQLPDNDETNSKSTDHPHVYKWEDLKQRYNKGHGTFFFGPQSHQITIPKDAKYKPQL